MNINLPKKFLPLFFLVDILVVAVIVGYILLSMNEKEAYSGLELDASQVSYEEATPNTFKIRVLEDKLGTITRIRVAPGGQMMFVTDLSGSVWVFKKENGSFVKQEKPFYEVDTGFEGFPSENGLTGIAFGADFEESKDIFLLYAVDTGNKGVKNRITRMQYEEDDGEIKGVNPVNIFDSNREAAGAHQIQNAKGIMIDGKSHLLFALGENYNPPDARDLSKEAGKFMLIQADGSDPVGTRPFADHPKIVAVGIRNVYGFDIDTHDIENRVAFLDNGPNVNDRFGYAKLIDLDGALAGGLDFNWDGEDDPIKNPVPDKNITGNPNTLLFNWERTVSPNEVIFYPGKGIIPSSDEENSYALVLLFGQTGTNDSGTGKQIALAKIERKGDQPKVSFTSLIKRSDSATSHAGNPLGLDYDPETMKIYFGDLVEGRIYEVEPITQ